MRRIPALLVHFAGLLAFTLPFLMSASRTDSPVTARSNDAPWILAILVPLLIAFAISESGRSRLDAKSIALLGVLSACAAVLRLPVSFAGANLMFFVTIIGGVVFGGSFGFLLGALSMAASALITGGVGPWLPFQMWAGGWVAMGASMLRPLINRQKKPFVRALTVAPYAYISAFVFGALMNLYFWPVIAPGDASIGWQPGLGFPEAARHYASFYAATSLGWDAVGAIFNALLVVVAGPALIELLTRYRARFEVSFVPAEDAVLDELPDRVASL